MPGEVVAAVISAQSLAAEAVVYIMRPRQNVSVPNRPSISMLKLGKTHSGRVSEPGSEIAIGDEVACDESTSAVLEFVIGGKVAIGRGMSVRITGERNVRASGYALASEIKQLGKEISWQALRWIGPFAAAKAVSKAGSAVATFTAFRGQYSQEVADVFSLAEKLLAVAGTAMNIPSTGKAPDYFHPTTIKG